MTTSNLMATIEPYIDTDSAGDGYRVHFEGGKITDTHMQMEFSEFSIAFQGCQLDVTCESVGVVNDSFVEVAECNATLPPVAVTLESVHVQGCNGSDVDVSYHIIIITVAFTDDEGEVG